MDTKPESSTSPNDAAIPIANERICSLVFESSCPRRRCAILGIASFDMSMTPSTSVVSARHLRMCSERPRIRTEKTAVVNTFICAMIEKVEASRCCSAMKPRMFMTRYVTAGTIIFHEWAIRKLNLLTNVPEGTSLWWPPKAIC